jgi:hypothetical protein
MPAERTTMRQVREVLRLKFVGGVPTREIARRIGGAPSTVRSSGLTHQGHSGMNWGRFGPICARGHFGMNWGRFGPILRSHDRSGFPSVEISL